MFFQDTEKYRNRTFLVWYCFCTCFTPFLHFFLHFFFTKYLKILQNIAKYRKIPQVSQVSRQEKMRYLRGGLNGTNMCCVLLTLLNRSLLPLFLEAHSWWIWIQWGFFCQMPSDFRVDGHEKKLNPSIMDWAIFVVPTAQCEREVPVVDNLRFPP